MKKIKMYVASDGKKCLGRRAWRKYERSLKKNSFTN